MNVNDVEYLPPTGMRDAAAAGSGFFSSPDDLLNAAKQTDDFVTGLADAIRRGGSWLKNVPAGNGKAVQEFFNNWKTFYGAFTGSRVWLLANWFTSDLQGKLQNFQNQAADWGQKFKKWGATIAAPSPSASGGASNTFMWIGIAAVSIIGLFIIGKLVHTVALGGADLEEAEAEAMKIAEAKKRKKSDRHVLSIT